MFVCVVLLVFSGLAEGGVLPNYNLTVSNVQNGTAPWFVELRLEYDTPQLFDMYLSNSKDATVARALGYELVPGMGYYKLFVRNLKPWEDAKRTCESDGTHLLIINSDLEALVIKAMVERNPQSRPWGHWVGFQDANKTGDYRTIFNESINSTGYNHWNPGQPNAEGSHRCGYFQFIPDKMVYGVGVYLCTHANPFICEQEIDC
ncbi:hypothetical protein C0J52_05180 [Blattella germanica]|nr:hypothetical protein C0J52_05180 [Blattella germanica]